jgi:hypothetical protein
MKRREVKALSYITVVYYIRDLDLLISYLSQTYHGQHKWVDNCLLDMYILYLSDSEMGVSFALKNNWKCMDMFLVFTTSIQWVETREFVSFFIVLSVVLPKNHPFKLLRMPRLRNSVLFENIYLLYGHICRHYTHININLFK